MRNEIAKTEQGTFSLAPTSLDEAMRFSDLISKSNFVPTQYKGKAGDVLVAVQMGSEVGLPPMQALQNIAVINGRPSIWGDAALAICQNHPKYEYIKEQIVGEGDNLRAECTIKRKGEDEHTSTFSVMDAKKAGLWGKAGPWTNYPKVMLKNRARGFALRDKFADAMKGLITREEAEDYPREMKVVKEEKTYSSKADMLAAKLLEEKQPSFSEDDSVVDIVEEETLLERTVQRIYDLNGDDGDIMATCGISSMDELEDVHIESLNTLGLRLKSMVS